MSEKVGAYSYSPDIKSAIGICLGAYSISSVLLEEHSGNIRILNTNQIIHNGTPGQYLEDILCSGPGHWPNIVITGRKFRKLTNITNISETEASEYALSFLLKKYNFSKLATLASLGAETFLVYDIDSSGHIINVNAKNKCGSGTGEFFLQQIRRMNLKIAEAVQIGAGATPYRVSGRCSVFCKSDCTHALNIGVNKANVCAGLAQMIAEKIEELLPNNNENNIILVGGITRNTLVINHLLSKYPNCIIPEEATYFEALGAGICALKKSHASALSSRSSWERVCLNTITLNDNKPTLPEVDFKEATTRNYIENEECILGLDVGSTTTKAVLLAKSDNAILASAYIYTNGNPIKAAKECYKIIQEAIEPDSINKAYNTNTSKLNDQALAIVGLGTTGSGRHVAALHAQTNAIFNEITAHSNAAVFYDKDVDTIFEIGGQDAKYTYINNLVPIDYAMNDACSAGTGSFIEEVAWESLGVKVHEIEALALKADAPANFSDQCAAFISSDIKTAQQEGVSRENIIAGLTYSICYNYLNRVKGNRKIGNKIFMQGGVCYNKAIPIAMAAISGKHLIVPPNPGLMGAFGVALEVNKRQQNGLLPIRKYNLNELIIREIKELPGFICKGNKQLPHFEAPAWSEIKINSQTPSLQCGLKCDIMLMEIDGKKYPFGGACGKYSGSLKTGVIGMDFVKVRSNIIKEFATQ